MSPRRFEIDHRIRRDPGNRELGGSVRDDIVPERKASRTCHVGLTVAVTSAQPNAQSLDLAPAVVEQTHSDPSGIAGEPGDDDLAPVDAQASLLVGELTTDLQREGAGIGSVFAWVPGATHHDI